MGRRAGAARKKNEKDAEISIRLGKRTLYKRVNFWGDSLSLSLLTTLRRISPDRSAGIMTIAGGALCHLASLCALL